MEGKIMSAAEWEETSFNQAAKYAENGEWDRFCNIVETRYEIMQMCFYLYYDKIPNDMKRDLALNCYMSHGDNYPVVRQAVRKLPKIGRKDLPPELAALSEITVYRGGREDIHLAPYRISWTTDKERAIWFKSRLELTKREGHLYKGLIKPEKIIAFLTDRDESEVIQYRSVYALEELSNQ